MLEGGVEMRDNLRGQRTETLFHGLFPWLRLQYRIGAQSTNGEMRVFGKLLTCFNDSGNPINATVLLIEDLDVVFFGCPLLASFY